MARIILSICGEGRGHASRAISLIERLHNRHKILVMSFGEGFKFLVDYQNSTKSKFDLIEIEGIKYLYDRKGHLAPLKTYLCWARFIFLRIRSQCKRVDEIVLSFKPDLAIVDFEPCLPRVAAMRNIPCISADHQHFIRFCNNQILPPLLRIRAIIGSWVCRFYVPNADHYVITSFFKPEWRGHIRQKTTIIGPIIRDDLKKQEITDDGIILSYLRGSMPYNLKKAFLSCGYPIIVYGLGKCAPIKNIQFKEIERIEFIKDLARATAVIGAAGNQIIGESLFMGKPFYALPEMNHHEQNMNGRYLSHSGCGHMGYLEEIDTGRIIAFMQKRESIRDAIINRKCTCDALDELEDIIGKLILQNG